MALSLPFERLKHINDKYEIIVAGFFRLEVYGQIIPELFYYNAIDSSILSLKENDKLLQLFESQNKFKHLENYEYKLVYRASKDGQKGEIFKEMVYGKQNILCIISTGNDVFGGYTFVGWDDKDRYGTKDDGEAFIFSIRSSKDWPPAIFNLIKGNALHHQEDFHCMFGQNLCIWLSDNSCKGGGYDVRSFEKPKHDDYLFGGRKNIYGWVDIEDVEVFQLIAICI